MYMYYRESELKYLGTQAVSLVERSIIHCPYLGGPLLEVLLYTKNKRMNTNNVLLRYINSVDVGLFTCTCKSGWDRHR